MAEDTSQPLTDGAAVEKAVLYMRTSATTDSLHGGAFVNWQRGALKLYADVAGFEIVAEYRDTAADCAEPVEKRPGFSELLKDIGETSASIVLVKDADCFARNEAAHDSGVRLLTTRGVRLLTVNGAELTEVGEQESDKLWLLIAWLAERERLRTAERSAA